MMVHIMYQMVAKVVATKTLWSSQIKNLATFLRFKRLSDDFLSITTRDFILNLLSRFDDNYTTGAPNKGRAVGQLLHHKRSLWTCRNLKIGDEPNDTNANDLADYFRPVPNLGISCLHDADRFEYTWTYFWARLDLRGSFATFPVDLSKIGRQARPE